MARSGGFSGFLGAEARVRYYAVVDYWKDWEFVVVNSGRLKKC